MNLLQIRSLDILDPGVDPSSPYGGLRVSIRQRQEWCNKDRRHQPDPFETIDHSIEESPQLEGRVSIPKGLRVGSIIRVKFLANVPVAVVTAINPRYIYGDKVEGRVDYTYSDGVGANWGLLSGFSGHYTLVRP